MYLGEDKICTYNYLINIIIQKCIYLSHKTIYFLYGTLLIWWNIAVSVNAYFHTLRVGFSIFIIYFIIVIFIVSIVLLMVLPSVELLKYYM